MTSNEQREIEERMQTLDNHALLRLVAVEASDYRSEALEIASNELRRRHLDILNAEEYWKQFPLQKVGSDGFCAGCRNQTTDESPGDMTVVNFICGQRLIGHDDQCSACGSLLQTKWVQIILPIIPLGRYRVIYLEKGMLSSRYVGRRLRKKAW
jgi:hypothetical protein